MMLQSFSSVICLVCFSMLQLRQASLALLPTGWQRPKKPCLSPSCNSSGSCGLLSCFLEGPRCHHLKNIGIWMCINYSTVWYLKRTLSKTRWYIITGVYNYEHRITYIYIYNYICILYMHILQLNIVYKCIIIWIMYIYIYRIFFNVYCKTSTFIQGPTTQRCGSCCVRRRWSARPPGCGSTCGHGCGLVGRHGWNGGKCLQRWPKVEMSYIVSSKLHVMRSMSSGLLA